MAAIIPNYNLKNSPNIPVSIGKWLALVQEHGLNNPNARLELIRDRGLRPNTIRPEKVALSGSTMAGDDFLFLRAIWPGFPQAASYESALNLLQDVSLLDKESWRYGLEKLGLDEDLAPTPWHVRTLVSDTKTRRQTAEAALAPMPQTPRSSKPAAPSAPKKAIIAQKAEATAISSNALPHLHQFIDALASKQADEATDAQHLGAFFSSYDIFGSITQSCDNVCLPWLNLNPAGLIIPRMPSTPPRSSMIASLNDLSLEDSPTLSTRGSQTRQSTGLLEDRADSPNVNASDLDDKADVPFADETFVTTFASTFFNTLASSILPGGRHHRMQPRRVQYRCGDMSGKVTYFNATVDAIVESKVRFFLPIRFLYHRVPI